jgi:small-conductance mechanosensitive channel
MQDEPPEEHYIPVEEVAVILGVTIRQASRYADRVRTRKAGKRVLFHKGDIDAVAEEKRIEDAARGEARKYEPPKSKTELVPVGEMLDYLRERDAKIDQQQQQLIAAARRIGELEVQLQQRLLPEDAQHLRQRLAEVEAQATQLHAELERKNKSWWERLFGTPTREEPLPVPPRHEETSTTDET